MFRKVNVPVSYQPNLSFHFQFLPLALCNSLPLTTSHQILGMIQNMSVFTCPACNHSTHIFGSDGVIRACETHEIDLLGDIPLHARICDDADRGKPTVVAEPESERARAFATIAEKIASIVKL